jgi:hypothetical protein
LIGWVYLWNFYAKWCKIDQDIWNSLKTFQNNENFICIFSADISCKPWFEPSWFGTEINCKHICFQGRRMLKQPSSPLCVNKKSAVWTFWLWVQTMMGWMASLNHHGLNHQGLNRVQTTNHTARGNFCRRNTHGLNQFKPRGIVGHDAVSTWTLLLLLLLQCRRRLGCCMASKCDSQFPHRNCILWNG